MAERSPQLRIIAGPNGSGKTTFVRRFLPLYAEVRNFINADLIAAGLAPFAPETAALRAGRLVLSEIERLAAEREDFAFETTLSGKTYEPMVRRFREAGYLVYLYFLWLPNVGMNVERVASRVIEGGHDVPEKDVRRRYSRGIANFLDHFRFLAQNWIVYDNSGLWPRPFAFSREGEQSILDEETFARFVAARGEA